MRDEERRSFSCAEVDERIEELVDGALGAEEARLVDEHLGGCPACRAQLEAAQSLPDELAAHFAAEAAGSEAELAAIRATVGAFNAIEAGRRGPPRPADRRRPWLRALALLGGWTGAILVGVRAAQVAGAPSSLVPSVERSPVVSFASALFSAAPAYFVAGLALLALALGASIAASLQRD
jgi:anti-sigma factor RsiW